MRPRLIVEPLNLGIARLTGGDKICFGGRGQENHPPAICPLGP